MAKRHKYAGLATMPQKPDVPPDKGFRSDRMASMRRRRELTQADLAKLIGVQTRQVQRWERGENEPDAFAIGRIAKALGVSSDWLLGLVPEPNNHLGEIELSPDERKILAAFDRGDLDTILRLARQVLKKHRRGKG